MVLRNLETCHSPAYSCNDSTRLWGNLPSGSNDLTWVFNGGSGDTDTSAHDCGLSPTMPRSTSTLIILIDIQTLSD